jgi:hypothetical protein
LGSQNTKIIFYFIKIENIKIKMNEEDNFDEVLNNLQDKISQFDNKTSKTNHLSFLKKIDYKSPFVFPVIIFFILSIILIILKPNFIKYSIQNNDGSTISKISYKKLLYTCIFLTLVLSVSLYYFKLR